MRIIATALCAIVLAPLASAQSGLTYETPLPSFIAQCGSSLQGVCRQVVATTVSEILDDGACPSNIPGQDTMIDASYSWALAHAGNNTYAARSIDYAIEDALYYTYDCDDEDW